MTDRGENRQTWYFTFGASHEHANRFVVFNDRTADEARALMLALFGRDWAFQYGEEAWLVLRGRERVTQAEKWGLTQLDPSEFPRSGAPSPDGSLGGDDAEELLAEWLTYTGLRQRAFDPDLNPDDDEYESGRDLVNRTDRFLARGTGALEAERMKLAAMMLTEILDDLAEIIVATGEARASLRRKIAGLREFLTR